MSKFRSLNTSEKKIVVNSISSINGNIIRFLEDPQYRLYISHNNITSKNNYPLVFLIDTKVSEVIEEINVDINSAGLYLGFIKNIKFNLSLEGAEFLHKSGLFSEDQSLYVNIEGEKSVLYGNKITKKMIEKGPSNLIKNAFLLVFNNQNELISLAISQIDYSSYQNLKSDEILALNLIDKGYYLRIKQ